MRRSYEFRQEIYAIEDNNPWSYPSYIKEYHSPSQNIHKMHNKSSFDHHETPLGLDNDHHHDMRFNETHIIYDHDDGSRGWRKKYHVNDDRIVQDVKENEHHGIGMGVKSQGVNQDDDHGSQGWYGKWDEKSKNVHYLNKNKHHAMGVKTLLRPPLGSTNLPSHQYGEHTIHGQGQVGSNQHIDRSGVVHGGMLHNHRYVDGPRKYGEEMRSDQDYYPTEGLHGEMESLIKGLQGLRAGGGVKKIEVIEYERRNYGSNGRYMNGNYWVRGSDYA